MRLPVTPNSVPGKGPGHRHMMQERDRDLSRPFYIKPDKGPAVWLKPYTTLSPPDGVCWVYYPGSNIGIYNVCRCIAGANLDTDVDNGVPGVTLPGSYLPIFVDAGCTDLNTDHLLDQYVTIVNTKSEWTQCWWWRILQNSILWGPLQWSCVGKSIQCSKLYKFWLCRHPLMYVKPSSQEVRKLVWKVKTQRETKQTHPVDINTRTNKSCNYGKSVWIWLSLPLWVGWYFSKWKSKVTI